MHRPLALPAAILVSALALGCSTPNVTEISNDVSAGSPGPSTGLARATVSRFTDFVGDFLIDEEQQLSALVGRSYETLVSVCTTGADNPDTGLVQVVQHDSSANVLVRAKDVNVVVWTTILPPDDCGLFLSTTPFATGTVRLMDHISQRADNGRFNLSAHYVGTVTRLETGQQYHFGFTGHIVVTPSGQVHFSGGDIKLTPIGG